MAGSVTEAARARLRRWLTLFLVSLTLPGGLLIYKAYDQLKWESFRRQQLLAEDLAGRVDGLLADLIRTEEDRPPDDYGFLTRPGSTDKPQGRRSPLAAYPPNDRIPGLMGWFEVGEDGRFSTPWLPGPGVAPAQYGIDGDELARRQAGARRIESVLIGNRLAEAGGTEERAVKASTETLGRAAASAPAPSYAAKDKGAGERRAKEESMSDEAMAGPATRLSQAAFERLAAPLPGNRADAWAQGAAGPAERPIPDAGPADGRRADAREGAPAVAPLLESGGLADREQEAKQQLAPARQGLPGEASGNGPVRLFDVSREPFRLVRLESGHLVLFRRALRDGERVIQGLLIEQGPFLSGLIGRPFAASPLAATADLSIAHRGDLLARLNASAPDRYQHSTRAYAVPTQELTGELLLRTRLQEPFGALELIFSIRRLPVPPGAAVIAAMAGALALILIGGTWFLWRLGAKQIALASQQQAFVSAVSHELKTPLTSIRLYAEMLRAGFADEARRETYYRYIQEESERLSRLIANVLQLSRMSRGELRVAPRPVEIAALMEAVRERITAPAERAGFRVEIRCAGPGRVQADPDAFVQVLINLVDNALKFAAAAEPRLVEIDCERLGLEWWRFRVRDYGPGVPKSSRRHIFRLFYRGRDAVRQAVPGTGIGLALVQGLTRAMGGRVTVVNRDPGAELRIELRAVADDTASRAPAERLSR